MKKVAIINKKCFGKRSKRLVDKLLRYLSEAHCANIEFSEYPRQIGDIVRRNGDADLFIPAGGDGTVHEVINAMDIKRHVLSIIPFGAGNTLARDLGIDIRKKIASNDTRAMQVDLLKCEFISNNEKHEKYVFSMAGAGYFADTCNYANTYLECVGIARYFFAGILFFILNRTLTARISVDHAPFEKKSLNYLLINNTKHVANYLYFPYADIKDGLMDVIMTDTSDLSMFFFSIGVLLKKIFYHPFKYRKVTSMDIEFDSPKLLMLDGEIYNNVTFFSLTISEKKLKLVL